MGNSTADALESRTSTILWRYAPRSCTPLAALGDTGARAAGAAVPVPGDAFDLGEAAGRGVPPPAVLAAGAPGAAELCGGLELRAARALLPQQPGGRGRSDAVEPGFGAAGGL